MTQKRFTFVDLFSGAGGFSEGFLLAGSGNHGFTLAAASDISPMVQATYEGRFGDQLGLSVPFVLGDIRHKQVVRDIQAAVRRSTGRKTVDVVCGGPPCQGFAVFGPRNQADPRNDLFRSYLKVIEALQPKYFVMENVPGLVSMYGGRTVEKIFEAVAEMGSPRYRLFGPIVLNAADFGVPQVRQRIVFVGCRVSAQPIEGIRPRRSRNETEISAGDAINDLAFLKPWETATEYSGDFPAASTYQRESRRGRLFAKLGISSANMQLSNHEAARHSPQVLARFSMLDRGAGLESIPQDLWNSHLKTAKKWCVRLDDRKPSNTIVTLPDDLIHPTQPRILTVREAARLQSFDDTFVFRGPRATGGGGAGNKMRAVEVPQYSQVGNAIPPLLAMAIADVILEALESARPSWYNQATANGRENGSHASSRTVHNRLPPRNRRQPAGARANPAADAPDV